MSVVPFFIPHLGCPHRCVFCDQEKVAGASCGLPAPAELLARVAQYAEKARGRDLEAAFYGGTFTALPRADQKRLLSPLQPLLAQGALKSLRISTRPDSVDADTASFLKSFGVATVELGVQSMDAEVLRLSGRGHDAADVESAVAALKEAGIEVGIQLMPGLPGDSPARSLNSLARVLALSPSFLRIYPTLVISGTELSRMYTAGSYSPLSLEDAVNLCKEMLVAATRAGVPVIRMGLQPTAELEAPGVVLAGPYHPAFRQLVESELCFDQMSRLLSALPRGSRVSFTVPRGKTSDLVGQKRQNLSRVSRLFDARVVAVREDAALEPHTVSVEWDGGAMSAGL
ncbi:elongator complex protein 3 [Citrifermentans bremense]|uniref:elongator complex protein 3 n=1 Tax=Citrifermentans bremense TaxID=60035 RepID=UPI00041434C4|nr:radical SAM protein [Citrifermentans bremense]